VTATDQTPGDRDEQILSLRVLAARYAELAATAPEQDYRDECERMAAAARREIARMENAS
jgi:hypothetical protein